jgi:hypothetical protein
MGARRKMVADQKGSAEDFSYRIIKKWITMPDGKKKRFPVKVYDTMSEATKNLEGSSAIPVNCNPRTSLMSIGS